MNLEWPGIVMFAPPLVVFRVAVFAASRDVARGEGERSTALGPEICKTRRIRYACGCLHHLGIPG